MTTPELSVVMPTYQDAHSLKFTLMSLSRQTLPVERFEAVVVCDGPGDGYEGIEEYAKGIDLNVTTLPKRLGRSGARNAAMAEAVGDIVLFLDSDCYAHPDLLSRHLEFHERQTTPRVMMGVRHELSFTHMGFLHRGETVPDDLLAAIKDETRFLGSTEADIERNMETPWLFAHSNNASLPAGTLADIGGFNEEFGTKWGWEDLEIFYRVYKHLDSDARAFVTDMDAVVYHVPKYRDPKREYLDFFDNEMTVRRLHRHYDFELNTMRLPFTVAAKIRYYRQAIQDCLDAKTCRLAPVWSWVEPKVTGQRVLCIGTGAGEVPLPAGAMTFDYAAPPSATNFHLIGSEIPAADRALDVVVSVDFWRSLQWDDFCGFVRESLRVAPTLLLAHTADDRLALAEPNELDFVVDTLAHDFEVTKEGQGDITGITVRRRA